MRQSYWLKATRIDSPVRQIELSLEHGVFGTRLEAFPMSKPDVTILHIQNCVK